VFVLLRVVWPISFWEELTESVNNYIQSLKGFSEKYTKYFQNRQYSVKEIMIVVALHQEIETFGKTSGMPVVKAWKDLPKNLTERISYDYFKFLNAHMAPDNIDNIMDTINAHAMEAIIPGSVLAVDEATYAYKPSAKSKKDAEKKGDPIPHE